MRCELITIGSELLLGSTLDTNGAEIGRALAAAGVRLVRRTSVGDEREAIQAVVSEALARSGAVITTGGLGPTSDDITKHAVADLFGAPLEFQDSLWRELVDRFQRFGRIPVERNRSQAEVPRGAIVLPNPRGTAPGLWLESDRGIAIMLPGVPAEMRGLLHEQVLPRLASRGASTTRPILSRTVRTFGLPESSLAQRLEGMESAVAPLSLAYLPGVHGVDLRLTSWGLARPDAEARLAEGAARLRQAAGDSVYGMDEDDLAALVLDLLRARGQLLAVAESCTGGMLGQRVTEVPGSSQVFLGGVIAYANQVKTAELAVSEELIAAKGAVSEEVAHAMAIGAAHRLGADAAVSITGIAGPDGGTAEKPVGLVYLGVWVAGEVEVQRSVFPGSRTEIRQRACQAALFRLFRMLRDG
jgi:nicotinamide-nucleotide amidase